MSSHLITLTYYFGFTGMEFKRPTDALAVLPNKRQKTDIVLAVSQIIRSIILLYNVSFGFLGPATNIFPTVSHYVANWARWGNLLC